MQWVQDSGLEQAGTGVWVEQYKGEAADAKGNGVLPRPLHHV